MSEPHLAIAIVDDEAPVRKALARLLRSAGFGVSTFSSGEEFLDSLVLHCPDCAVLDLHLPGRSGFEVQQQLAQQHIPIPCIVITGKDEPGTAERAMASGAADFLLKPVDAARLLEAITSAVPAGTTLERFAKPADSINQGTAGDGEPR